MSPTMLLICLIVIVLIGYYGMSWWTPADSVKAGFSRGPYTPQTGSYTPIG